MAGLPQVGLEAVITNLPQFTAGARAITSAYDTIDKKSSQVETTTAKLGRSLLDFGKFAAQAGIAAFAAGLGAAATTGFQYNNMLQQASARIQAFTKDSELTAQTIELIRTEAAKTPFTFGEMVTAAASLQPVMRASGESLQDLIKDAEILAASNPLQGLEGASFALREAISGDFTSIIERFNLSRLTINRLKDEGVPNIEIVRRAMQEMGFDAELVANMAGTMEGRWSTFSDTMTNLAGIVTQPMFDQISDSLGRFNTALAENEQEVTGFAQTLSGATQKLAEGLDAWTFVLTEAIPTIQEYNANLAKQAAQSAINAQSQAELDAAWQQGRTDFKTFTEALVAGTDNVEQYNDIIKRGAQGNYFLADSLTLTADEYKRLGGASGPVAKIQAELITKSETLAATYGNTTTATQTLIAAQMQLSYAVDTAAAAFGGQITAAEAAMQVTLAMSDTLSQANAQAAAFGGQMDPFTQNLALARLQEAENMRLEAIEREQEARREAAEEMDRIQKQSAEKMADAFDQAASDIRTTIENVLQPTLDEVWSPPEDSQVRFDEAARRLATVATSGFGSEWLTTLTQQFGTQDFFQPIIQAMQTGDPEALKNAATGILTNNVAQLWDVEVIKQKVREQLQAQQLREQIIDQVQQELGMEGVTVPMDNITTSAGTMVTAVNTAATSITTAGGGASTAAPQFEALDTSLGDISQTINQNLRTAFSNLVNFISSQVLPRFSDLTTFFNEEFAPAIVNLSETVFPDWSVAMDDIIEKIKDATEYFKGLKTEVEGFSLPDELQPGSPPPMAIALQDVAEAAQIADSAIDALSQGITNNSPAFADFMVQIMNISGQLQGFNVSEGQAHDISNIVENLLPQFAEQFEAGTFTYQSFLQGVQQGLAAIGGNLTVAQVAEALEGAGITIESIVAQFNENFLETQRIIRLANAAQAAGVAGQFAQFGITAGERLQSEIEGQIAALEAIIEGGEGGTFEGEIISAVQAQEMLNAALEEQAAVQQQIVELQQQQADLQFLQQQISLIQMINEAGLDASEILGGITLGLDASLPDIIAAMNNVVEAMINQIDEDLAIQSPSKVMADKAKMAMAGFTRGLVESVPGIQAAAQGVISGPMVNAPVGGGWAGNQKVTNNYFDMSVNTGASPQAVVYQYEVMRAMVG